VPGDRRREVAVLAVLGKDDAGKLGIVTRHHEHEPSVIAQIFVRSACALFALQ
jgi:hypothetical protein